MENLSWLWTGQVFQVQKPDFVPHVYIAQKQISMLITVVYNSKEHLVIYCEKSLSQKWGIQSLYNEYVCILHRKEKVSEACLVSL